MANVPETSTTLLRDLACDSQHARWAEFVARYRPMMEAYMQECYPTLDADEVIQQTLISLIKVFPVYHYSPNQKGSFHNYLTGVLRHRAVDILKEERRQADLRYEYAEKNPPPPTEKDTEAENLRKSMFDIALQQLLADDTIHQRTKQIFLRTAVNGESPSEVGAAFGLTRNAVDQIKNRMIIRMRELVSILKEVDEGRNQPI